ncbi:MAG: TadE/TadG family type IV pilus assembly protein [Pseudomonadota bacterium]
MRFGLLFWRDQRGGISFEFTIVFPLLMALLISSFGFFNAFRAADQHAKVSYVINDMVSRDEEVTDADLAEIALLQRKMLPDSMSGLGLRISSICFAGGSHKVMWSYTNNDADGPAWRALKNNEVPAGILPGMQEQENVILTETMAYWAPPISSFWVGPRSLASELVIRPRLVQMLIWKGQNESNVCPST